MCLLEALGANLPGTTRRMKSLSLSVYAMDMLYHYQSQPAGPGIALVSNSLHWHPLPHDFLKLNCDVAAVDDSNGDLGVVIRNDTGQPMLSVYKQFKEAHSVLEAEATAALFGL